MENKINIAELLKDCPRGMELDCVSYDNVSFDKISDDKKSIYPIFCYITDKEGNRSGISFTKNGCESKRYGAKCVIFPKGKTTWEGFQRPFKDGDIVFYSNTIAIFNEWGDETLFRTYCVLYTTVSNPMYQFEISIPLFGKGIRKEVRFATEEEKAKLFQAIKDNGYKWNPETKTLEKVVESRFHAGYWITDGISKYQILFIDDIQYWYSENGILGSIESVDKRYHHWTIQDAEDGDVLAFDDDTIVIFKDLYNKTTFHSYCHIEDGVFSISELDCPDWWDIKFKPATKEQRDFLFQKIKEAGYRWNAETKTLEKLIKSHTPKKFYIRIGDIPSEEKSAVYKGDVVIGYEDGVSVYDCVETDGLYRIVMPFPLKEGQGMTYECLIQEITQCRYKIENPRNVYLVSGMEVGKGNDNEPLIKEVKILKDLTSQFNTKNGTEETKTLEKLVEPKFKVGDKVRLKSKPNYIYTIHCLTWDDNKKLAYKLLPKDDKHLILVSLDIQDDYELVPSKFDITTLKPFDKVLVRADNSYWRIQFFERINKKNKNYPFVCMNGYNYKRCIPYEGNEHLLGTTDGCNEYFKTWE